MTGSEDRRDGSDRSTSFDPSDLPIHDDTDSDSRSTTSEQKTGLSSSARRVSTNAIPVTIADYAVTDADVPLKTSGLGSCIGVAIHDEEAFVSGLLHFMLPKASQAHSGPHPEAKFADTGIEAMLSEFRDLGGDPTRSWAKGAGGATMIVFEKTKPSIGERNADALRRELETHDVSIVGTDFGGNHGRSLEFVPGRGTLTITGADGTERTL
ncbi:chemotaxis protein CheD [Natrarchaeobius halalkaliphilus]|uniref:Probable chemoreceptor glutamine deamidase CheD n=1 Tax=Natrarchaeobius halalkaliphilus TaxID=1679091 RepID=A0A3N6MR88_9EURY|nr:chemotaxis protein CheD [Natrarchaeobius halalkaliphilus]RQG86763.1 chemotaxis protein CheD [Natrarchaeobius halalkaliphilus]